MSNLDSYTFAILNTDSEVEIPPSLLYIASS